MSIEFDTAVSNRHRLRQTTSLVRALECAGLAVVPALLLAVYALPAGLRRSLVFDYGNPTALTAVVAPFVHLDVGHLLVNVVGYAVVVPVAYALAVASGRRREFWVVFVTFVVAFPPILSLSNLAVPRVAYGVGYSGVVLAFVGYLPIGIGDHLESAFDIGPRATVAPATFFVGLALVAGLCLRALAPSAGVAALGTGGIALASLLCAVLFGRAVSRDTGHSPTAAGLDDGRASLDEKPAGLGQGRAGLLVVAGVVLLGMQFVAFPADPVVPAGTVNLYVHLLGYALGFTVVYATRQFEARLASGASPESV